MNVKELVKYYEKWKNDMLNGTYNDEVLSMIILDTVSEEFTKEYSISFIHFDLDKVNIICHNGDYVGDFSNGKIYKYDPDQNELVPIYTLEKPVNPEKIINTILTLCKDSS